jgi:ATP adenylyltransferase
MKDTNTTCPFCSVGPDRIKILENSEVYCMLDRSPISLGHALIIPKRHCPDYFDLSPDEQTACWKMVDEAKILLSEQYHPDGFNIVVNVGEPAGQTVFHVHVHLIPRYWGQDYNIFEKKV